MLDHGHVYRDLRAGARNYRGKWDFGIAAEHAVERALDGFGGVLRDMLDDPGPATRSLTALLLTRNFSVPDADRELLRSLDNAEPDEHARA
jgi:hypothetical protein